MQAACEGLLRGAMWAIAGFSNCRESSQDASASSWVTQKAETERMFSAKPTFKAGTDAPAMPA